jgi:3-isopropylmalate/(R)-2-methylmalate dehydratase small subunit
MHSFTRITGIAVPIDEPNIDTNQLIPTRFNKVPRGPGHARILFHDRRFNADGSEKDFILNREPYRHAKIIVADRNWGGGSGREGAVWAMYEFGIRCVIASSIADIHINNCNRVGFLAVVLPDAGVTAIRKQLHEQPGAMVTVDLPTQTVTDPAGQVHRFDIHPVRKRCLLEGLDNFARTGQYSEAFKRFEDAYRAGKSWLFNVKN